MNEKNLKLEKALVVSEEILENIENNDIPFENVLFKCIKLARLRDDYDSVDWFQAELQGYGDKEVINVDNDIIVDYVKRSGRLIKEIDEKTKEEKIKYWTLSISSIETTIQSKLIELENLKLPSSFTPAISKSASTNNTFGGNSNEFVVEKYQDVFYKIRIESLELSQRISEFKTLLSKIKTKIHKYILNINFQLRFENITESIFQDTKLIVDKKLSELCPDTLKKFIAAYERLKSENPEEWSQAMSSCRNILKEFADFVFPPQKDKYKKKSGEELDVTDDKYKNRIIAFLDVKLSGEKRKYLESRMSDLEARIHILNELLSKGTHVGMELTDVKICLIDTYLLIGSLINLIK